MVIKDHRFVVHYPDKSDKNRVKVRLGEGFVNYLYPKDEDLDYHKVVLQKGQTVPFDPYMITLSSLEKEVTHPEYESQEGDIAVQARLEIRNKAGILVDTLKPVFIIRENQPNFIRDFVPHSGLAANFVKIDPATGDMEFLIGERVIQDEDKYPIRVAEDVPRSDFIVLEAIVFPGINLFWLGSILMMMGFFISIYLRRRTKLA